MYARHIKTPIFKRQKSCLSHIWLLTWKLFILFNYEVYYGKLALRSSPPEAPKCQGSLAVCLLLALKNEIMCVSSELPQTYNYLERTKYRNQYLW